MSNQIIDGNVQIPRWNGAIVMPNVINAVENALTTITVAQSGSIIFCPQSQHIADANHNAIQLPAPSAGFNLKIIFTDVGDGTGNHEWYIYTAANNILGSFVSITAGLAAQVIAAATNSFARGGELADALPGDYVNIYSNGTNYFIFGYSSGAATPWVV